MISLPYGPCHQFEAPPRRDVHEPAGAPMCRERGILNVENLRDVDLIPRRVVTFIGLPLAVRNGCGLPIRAVALTED